MEERHKSMIIWLKNGQTLKFEQVKNMNANEIGIEFDYFGVSTRVERHAIFFKGDFAGFALEV
jgi:hypothetical protein